MRVDSQVEKKTQEQWDRFFLRICREYSTGSKDPSSKVAAAIVDQNHKLISISYNGFAEDQPDTIERYNDRETKYKDIVHAEVGALKQLFGRLSLKYIDNVEATIYVYPYLPCIDCAKKIVDSDIITRVVSTDYYPARWEESFEKAKDYLQIDSGINVEEYPINHIL